MHITCIRSAADAALTMIGKSGWGEWCTMNAHPTTAIQAGPLLRTDSMTSCSPNALKAAADRRPRAFTTITRTLRRPCAARRAQRRPALFAACLPTSHAPQHPAEQPEACFRTLRLRSSSDQPRPAHLPSPLRPVPPVRYFRQPPDHPLRTRASLSSGTAISPAFISASTQTRRELPRPASEGSRGQPFSSPRQSSIRASPRGASPLSIFAATRRSARRQALKIMRGRSP